VAYPIEVLLKIIIATVFGGVVGWQRELRYRPAGLRTHILVCVGSAVYTLASMSFGGNTDPSRIAAQVATGMGFLGAGTIIRHGSMVRGLTTAASLWTVAAIGICAGVGGRCLWVGSIATVVVLGTLTLMRSFELRVLARRRDAQIVFSMRDARSRIPEIQKVLEEEDVSIESLRILESEQAGLQEIQIEIRLPDGGELGQVSAAIGQLEGFVSIRQE
jgi:putative Mg2+ transporter-C (MgtC) family protein